MQPKAYQRIPALIAATVVLLVCLVRWAHPPLFEQLEWRTYDMRVRQALKSAPPVATNLGFIFINEESLKRVRDGSLGFYFGLLWPRQVYGRLVQELATQGARCVALDVLCGDLRLRDHPAVRMADGTLVESDDYFARQMRLAGNVVLAMTTEVTPPPLFRTNALALGDIKTEKDADGVLRRVQAFQLIPRWHPLFQKVEDDPGYGVDLREARVEPRRIILRRSEGDPIIIPLDQDGNFSAADFVGEPLPAGIPPKAKPFTEERVWHMGIVLAAQALKLDLDKAEVDLPHGRIVLRGPSGVERVLPVDARGYFYIDWCLPFNDPQLTQESIQNLLLQNYRRLQGITNGLVNRWHGKLAVVGSSAQIGNNLTDRGATPLDKDTLLVSKHWNVANSIILGRFVQPASLALEWALILVFGIVTAAVTWKLRVLVASGMVASFTVAYAVFAFVLYTRTRLWLPLVYPIFGAMLMNHVCLVIWRVVFEQAEKRRVRSIFSTVLAPEIVNELLKAESLSLGGARRQVTVLFADVRGFTEFTDTSQERVAALVRKNQLTGAAAEACFDEQARETLATVNLYLGMIADTIIQQGGTLDKFIGDCVMAFWGAPVSNPRHAVACVRAAIAAQRAIYALNQQRSLQNQQRELENLARISAGQPPQPLLPLLLLGTGINTGLATVGLMGSEAKTRNYTVFGREVNLASRLESASGRGRIFIGETTYEHLRRDDPELAATCVEQPPKDLKGFRTAVKVYEVPWRPAGAEPANTDLPKPGATDTTSLISSKAGGTDLHT